LALSECGVTDDCALHLVLRLRGGANMNLSFEFASMHHGQMVGSSAGAPDFRKIKPGFNLEGLCRNSTCKAWNQYVSSNLGYNYEVDQFNGQMRGGFNIGLVINEAPCPACGLNLDAASVKSCGFYKCEYAYKGYVRETGELREGTGKVGCKDKFEYHDAKLNSTSWSYLVIAVKPLSSAEQ